MLASLFKIFPFIWPFLKETLLGGRNHPIFNNRRGFKFTKIIIGVLIALCVSSTDAYLSAIKEVELLKQQLIVQRQNNVSENNVKLMICDNALATMRGELNQLTDDVKEGNLSCKQAKQKLAKIEEDSHNRIPPTIKESVAQRAQRKLNEMKD